MSHLRLQDVRRVHRLIDECRELGDDGAFWLTHLAQGVIELCDADTVGAGQISGIRTRKIASIGIAEAGFDRGFEREGWLNGLRQWIVDPYYSSVMNEAYRQVIAGQETAISSAHAVLGREMWHRSPLYQDVNRPMGCDAQLYCMFRIASGPDDTQTLVLNRRSGERDFTDREQEILRYLGTELSPLIGGPLAGFREIRPSDLPTRQRQVLACVLEGDSDKQIAKRLTLSPYTVNQYMKLIYRHFGVGARTELLARWIRRGWGGRFAWRSGEVPDVGLIDKSA
jgi:DNA-binding CsgD family transcriptional regulator